MLNKKIVAMTLAVAMVAGAFVGCGNKNNDKKNEPKDNKANATQKENKEEKEKKDEAVEKFRIGLVTDEGGVNDKSFNQSAHEGIMKIKEEAPIDYKFIESQSKDDYEENMGALIDSGYEMVFGIGYQMADAVLNIANSNPDAKIGIIDFMYDEQPSNVQSITFKEHEGSFLVGVIAGLTTKTNKIGFIGGKDVPLINKFEVGFAAGVMSVNPEAGKILASRKTVKYAESYSDVNLGYELGKALYDEGADVIYHAAGGVGLGLFKATDELKAAGQDVWAIGVDKDQGAELEDYTDVILTSMVKRVDSATYNAVKAAAAGNFKGGEVMTLGLVENAVGVAPSSDKHVSADILKKVEECKKDIIDGKIVVPSNLEELANFGK